MMFALGFGGGAAAANNFLPLLFCIQGRECEYIGVDRSKSCNAHGQKPGRQSLPQQLHMQQMLVDDKKIYLGLDIELFFTA